MADSNSMQNTLFSSLKDAWSTTSFAGEEVTAFARELTADEARKGLVGLSLLLMFLFAIESLLFEHAGLGTGARSTCLLLAALCVHIIFSSRAQLDVRSLYLLGTTLLMISGMAFVLLAHNTGSFSLALFASVTLLFMAVPIVPWGIREALLVLSLIYATFTASTWGTHQNFDPQTLWSLQFIMLGSGLISLALVARNTYVRKMDIRTRFELEQTNRKMMLLSNKDPLTGAWNRRFLRSVFQENAAAWQQAGRIFHFAFLDLDDFKPMNDTYGHDFGDQVLRCISHCFAESLADDGYLIRMGGDEFALLCAVEEPERLITETLAAIQLELEPPNKGQEVLIGMSVGVASIPTDIKVTQQQIYRAADNALYQAKGRKRPDRFGANIARIVPLPDRDFI